VKLRDIIQDSSFINWLNGLAFSSAIVDLAAKVRSSN